MASNDIKLNILCCSIIIMITLKTLFAYYFWNIYNLDFSELEYR